MPRKARQQTASEASPTPAPAPFVVHPRAVYRPAQLREGLGLAADTIAREARLGRLRITKRGGKVYILGKWVLQWLAAGEVKKARAGPSPPDPCAGRHRSAGNGQ